MLDLASTAVRIPAMSDVNRPFAGPASRADLPGLRTGGCLCGAVKFSVTGTPINVRVCHCQDCQRLTGSAFFVRALYSKDLVTLSGELTEFPTSDDLIRKFCPRCGSQIFCERKSRPDTIAIALGSFDDSQGLCPSEHIWVSDKQEWLSLPPDTKQSLKATRH
jgi:hypothetical protein